MKSEIKSELKIIVNYIYEKDMDLLIIEEFVSEMDFSNIFTKENIQRKGFNKIRNGVILYVTISEMIYKGDRLLL